MKYLIFPSEADAQFRNHQIALSQGSGGPDDVTEYWFGMITKGSEAALVIEDETLITDEEKAELKGQTFMQQNGWL